MKQIKRQSYLDLLINKMNNGMIKVITGIRRSGKSYLLFKIFKEYLLLSGIKENQIIEIVLDSDKNASLRNPFNLTEYIKDKTANKRKKYYVLIDEIQYCKKIKNPDLPNDYITFYDVLNGLLRQENIDTYVTGSNSKMLSSDILTEFRGRGDQLHVFPLSFSEYFNSLRGIDFEDAFLEYSTYGGLPKVSQFKSDVEKSNYLKNLFEEVYLKDIIQRNKIKNEEGLKELMCVFASSIGSYTNPTKIENTFLSNSKIVYSKNAIAKHIDFLKDAFIILQANRFDIKGRKYIGANSKYYFCDIGIRNALLNFRQLEQTHIMENIIYNELLYRGFNVDIGIVELNGKNNKGISTRTQYEVDFVANRGNEKFYIQCAYSMLSEEKILQEKKSLKHIDDSFRKIIVTRGRVKPHFDDEGIFIIGIKDFLLNREFE